MHQGTDRSHSTFGREGTGATHAELLVKSRNFEDCPMLASAAITKALNSWPTSNR